MIERSAGVTGWSMLLIFFWPMADTLFAMYRRISNGRRIDAPDRLHFHQLVMRYLEICLLGRGRRNIANPLATAVLLPMIAAPAVTGAVFWNDSRTAFLFLMFYAFLFVWTYLAGIRSAARRKLPGVVTKAQNAARTSSVGRSLPVELGADS